MLFISRHACLAVNNIRERLHPPQRLQTDPILKPEHPWEAKGIYFQGSVLKDGNLFRMWYSAIGAKRRDQQYLGYAESPDGLHWQKVLRTECALGPWPQTNVLYGQKFNIAAPNVHFYHEPREGYRYFLVFDSRIEQHVFQNVPHRGGLTPGEKRLLMRHHNYTPDFDWGKYYPDKMETCRAIYLADSRDGLHWEPADGRFAIAGQSDGDHPVVYDPLRKFYRMYFRDNRIDENGERIRQVLTAVSADTIEWSRPEVCLESDGIDDPRVNQIHGMCVTCHAGLFIGLIQMMEIEEEVFGWHPLAPTERARFHVQLAVSWDGIHFHRVGERGEFFGTGAPQAFDAGMVRCGGQWVFDGDRMLMYYDARPYRHMAPQGGDGCSNQVGIGVASSPINRFAGLAPQDLSRPGHLLAALPAGATALTLNCAVGAHGGRITASLRYPDGCLVRSHTEDACLPVTSGGLREPLRWRGAETLPRNLGPLHLRLTLEGDATVYALE